MRIWADGDDCPPACAQALFTTAQRRGVMLTLISSRERSWPHSPFIRTSTLDKREIAPRLQMLALPGDLVVSDDEALFTMLRRRGIATLSPGSRDGLQERLDDLLDSLQAQLNAERLNGANQARERKLTQRARAREKAAQRGAEAASRATAPEQSTADLPR